MAKDLYVPPYYPKYAQDWLSSESVTSMTLEQQGAFERLLCYQWQQGSIPADKVLLAKLLGVDSSAIAELWQGTLALAYSYMPNDDTRLYNKRLEEHRTAMEKRNRERKESGYKGAVAHWGKKNIKNGRAIAELKHSVSVSVSSLTTPLPPKGGSGEIPTELKDPAFERTFEEWKVFRSAKKGVKAWDIFWQKQLLWLKPFGAVAACEILNQSMRNGWTGLFPLKGKDAVRAAPPPKRAQWSAPVKADIQKAFEDTHGRPNTTEQHRGGAGSLGQPAPGQPSVPRPGPETGGVLQSGKPDDLPDDIGPPDAEPSGRPRDRP